MANSAIYNLPTANTDPQITDLLAIEDDPGGTPDTQKITVENFYKSINGLTADGSPDTSTDYIVTYDASASGAKKVLLSSITSSGGLTNSIASVTTGNVTGVAGTRHILDASGMTANRSFVLPAGTANQEIEVQLSAGDDTYVLSLIGDTGITITYPGGVTAAATAWSSLFITGEVVRFVATSSTNWNVVHDGRIPCIAILERQAAQSIDTATTTKIALDTVNTNRGGMGDITTNDRINIRRSGIYQVMAFVAMRVDNDEYVEADLYKDGALLKFQRAFVSTAGSNQYASPEAAARGTFAAGTYFELYVTHTEGAAENTDTTYYPTLTAIEIL